MTLCAISLSGTEGHTNLARPEMFVNQFGSFCNHTSAIAALPQRADPLPCSRPNFLSPRCRSLVVFPSAHYIRLITVLSSCCTDLSLRLTPASCAAAPTMIANRQLRFARRLCHAIPFRSPHRRKRFDIALAGATEIDGTPAGNGNDVVDAARVHAARAEFPVLNLSRLDRSHSGFDAGRRRPWTRGHKTCVTIPC
jgi:hypothetical protein